MLLIFRKNPLTISCFPFAHRRTIHSQIIKELSHNIPETLSKSSSHQEIFNTAKAEYKDALRKSVYDADLKYTNNNSEKPKTRKRNMI